MGSSCVNLSRAVAAARRPGFGTGAGGHGRCVVALSSSSSRRRTAADGGVSCGIANGYLGGLSGGSRPPSLPVHGKSSGPGSGREAGDQADADADGLGIQEFLGGKNFLITGGTGFLAKVLIEKILRTNTDVGKIYVLIKAKDSETALQRLQNEVVDTELFKRLQEIHGKDYHGFIATKLVPVVGDVREANIGIAPELADEIAERVDIIVNSAANTTFDERYDVAMDINTVGPFRIMSFAHRFRRLKLFLQVSTAYVNGQRQGVVLEKPFRLGDTIGKGSAGSSDSSEQHKNAVLDIEAEIKLAFDSRSRADDDPASFSQEMKDLGLERAKLHGWQDTYVFTKAMGEMVINSMRGEIPVVTIRPSVIESTWRDPFPGWMEGNRMMDPVVLYYGKGQLSGFLADPAGVLDVVPADMVVNATLAAMAKHGRAAEGGMHVYHVASSTVNPLVFGDLSRFLFQHFTSSPYSDAAGQPIAVPPMRLFDTMEQFASYVETDALLRSARAGAPAGERLSQRLQELCAKSVEQTIHLGSIYQPYTFYTGRFDNCNTEGLMAEMSAQEKAGFHFDVRSIDWTDYITNVHIPGLRKHVMKGRGIAATSSSPSASPSTMEELAAASASAV
ncbi:fatty acyl-CoA reductase 2, chloroplastic-like [Hordeum vulgare subsp. vulgare]|uniref:Fatty acyl-CoA reductase n=1 Tax=Hordeum vulgare subsp. vulgare TaxID=112509 RepID=A0A8I6XNT3_HORVV|nr:fatty acyl-CoA reductase 2, chloroplastic-like [Hordeum vulgare subsp. vulgare]